MFKPRKSCSFIHGKAADVTKPSMTNNLIQNHVIVSQSDRLSSAILADQNEINKSHDPTLFHHIIRQHLICGNCFD